MPRVVVKLSPSSALAIRQICYSLDFYIEFWKDIRYQMSYTALYNKIEQDKQNTNYLIFKHKLEERKPILTKVTFIKSKQHVLISSIAVKYDNKEYCLQK
jgi:hypothetical protein